MASLGGGLEEGGGDRAPKQKPTQDSGVAELLQNSIRLRMKVV
jgi:hypothetical protein